MRSAISIDVENEFASVMIEAKMLAEALPTLQASNSVRALRHIEIAGLAATIETIFTGCERIMVMIAKAVDGEAVASSEGWHATLIKRLANPYPEVRRAILSDECRQELDRFRSFRHRVRNSYGMALDDEIVLGRAAEVARMLDLFHQDTSRFLAERDASSARN